MSSFPVQMRDINFTMYEHLKIEDHIGMGRDDIEPILDEIQKFAANVLAPMNKILDEKGVTRHEDGSVTTCPELKAAFEQYVEGGWPAMQAPEEFDGLSLPVPVVSAIDEIMTSACCAFSNYVNLTKACANMLFAAANDEQKKTWAVPMITGEWQGTMCLTEAGAGTDVGASRTKATPVGDGKYYKIQGSKVFITSGEHDLTKNFVHIVLARVEGDRPGSKGLSIFIVPKYRFGDDGEATVFNDVYCSGIEEKMGIHGSVTTSLEFGQNDDCLGELIGEQGQGIAIMFHIMNEERIAVGCQGQSIAAIAYGHALKYAQERIQGSSIRAGKSMKGEKISIMGHPDVRRMLMYCKAQSESLRALLFWTSRELHKSEDESRSQEERTISAKLTALMTPVCKAHGSEAGFLACSQAMQVFGGYGYCREYPAEQYVRDSRIACVYEGTNGIQAIDLLFRKILGDRGQALEMLDGLFAETSSAIKDHPRLSGLKASFDQARLELGGAAKRLGELSAKDLGHTALGATPLLNMLGNLMCSYLLIQQAQVAHEKLKELGAPEEAEAREAFCLESGEARFYASKIETARFHVLQILPENRWRAAQIMNDDAAILADSALVLQ